METTANLKLVLTRELDTEELGLEHDTVVISPELSRRIIEALRSKSAEAPVIDLPLPVGS